MAAPVRKIIVDVDAATPWRWKANGGAGVFTERVYFRDFAAAATTANLDLTGFPGGIVIEGAFVMFNTNFTGGAVATCTMSVGTTGSPAAYVAATTVFSGATVTAPIANVGLTLVPGTFLNAATPLGAGTVRVQLITTVANTNALTAGVADIWLRLRAVAFRAK
jgi:hypothetical protein